MLHTCVELVVLCYCNGWLIVAVQKHGIEYEVQYLPQKHTHPYYFLGGVGHRHVLWLHGGQQDDLLLPQVLRDSPSIDAECIARDNMVMFQWVPIGVAVPFHSWSALPISLFPGKGSSLPNYQLHIPGSLQVPYHPLHGLPVCPSRVCHESCQVGDGIDCWVHICILPWIQV